jgi:hypothetical protein
MIADANGAPILVLKGMVEASPHNGGSQRTIVLHEKQSRHFALPAFQYKRSRSEIRPSTQLLTLDRLIPATHPSIGHSMNREAGAQDGFGPRVS